MQAAKWATASRSVYLLLVDTLGLKEDDEIEIHVADERFRRVAQAPARRAAKRARWPAPHGQSVSCSVTLQHNAPGFSARPHWLADNGRAAMCDKGLDPDNDPVSRTDFVRRVTLQPNDMVRKSKVEKIGRGRGCDGGHWEINEEYPVSFVDRRPLAAHMALRNNRICSALDGILKFEQRVSFARRLMDILPNHRLAVESQRFPLLH
jgi:hypothetical protein